MPRAECESLICLSEESQITITEFRKAVELLASITYNLAKLLKNREVAEAVKRAVERYVRWEQASLITDCYLTCNDEKCTRDCEEAASGMIRKMADEILGVGDHGEDKGEAGRGQGR